MFFCSLQKDSIFLFLFYLCIWFSYLILFIYLRWASLKQWPLAPNSREWQITRANVARQVTFFSKMAFGECRRVWRVSHISENSHFGEYLHSPKTASFARVLKFAKFAGE
jgi:hypothetical protein